MQANSSGPARQTSVPPLIKQDSNIQPHTHHFVHVTSQTAQHTSAVDAQHFAQSFSPMGNASSNPRCSMRCFTCKAKAAFRSAQLSPAICHADACCRQMTHLARSPHSWWPHLIQRDGLTEPCCEHIQISKSIQMRHTCSWCGPSIQHAYGISNMRSGPSIQNASRAYHILC